jgi:hypothetical protein
MTDGVTERQVPFFCPYCGEETLRPAGPDAGAWQCDACARGFELRFAGVRQPQPGPACAAPPPGAREPAARRDDMTGYPIEPDPSGRRLPASPPASGTT